MPFHSSSCRADALRDDLLEVADAGGFNSFSLRFLFFFLQPEIHGQRFLLGLLFRFDRRFQCLRQLDVAQQTLSTTIRARLGVMSWS